MDINSTYGVPKIQAKKQYPLSSTEEGRSLRDKRTNDIYPVR